ncbi:MAG: 8-oxo-dGTP pyrophosphatase MutT (NUDIX family) [Arenicella sp.]|jgi:8-oxo-dGTP pyrophosphatase MutT (NUDIX family)
MQSFPTIYKKIQYALNDLPADLAHKEMYPLRKTRNEMKLENEDYRTSAVLALMFQEDGETKMILTQRHDYKGKHGGQISFPGGKSEATDQSIEHTALRETQEEIGLPTEDINIIGKLSDVYIPVSQFLVHPFIAYYNGDPTFIRSEYEVKEIITFNTAILLDSDTMSRRNIKTSEGYSLKDIPCFIIEEKIVWGATAIILNEIRHILMRA